MLIRVGLERRTIWRSRCAPAPRTSRSLHDPFTASVIQRREDNGPGPARISKMLKHNGARPQGRVPHPGPGRREEACEPEELALSGLRPVTHGADLVSVSGSALESVLRDINEVYH